MNDTFAAAMRHATDLTRAGDLAGAMRAIRRTLSTGADASDVAEPARPRLAPRRIDPGAETVEPLPDLSVRRPRRGLGDVVALMKSGKARLLGRAPTVRAAPAAVDGAQWLARSHSCAAGRRDYRLYVPASAPERPKGLVVMLHGCQQNPEDFAVGTAMNALAEAHGLLVAYPAQSAQANPSACWRWFEPGDQRRDAGEPAIIAGLTRALAAEFAVPDAAVFVAGLSAGGAMAAVMGRAYPEIYAAVGVHSGLAVGSASDVVSAFAAMRGGSAARGTPATGGPQPRVIVFHGAADATVHPDNAAHLMAAATPRGAAAPRRERGRAAGGRDWERTVILREDGVAAAECWLIDGAGHAWSGGDAAGSYTDPQGPDASAEMLRFFLGAARG